MKWCYIIELRIKLEAVNYRCFVSLTARLAMSTTDHGRLLATDISVGDQVSSFPSVIWLMEVWRCLCWL